MNCQSHGHVFNYCSTSHDVAMCCRECGEPNPDYVGKFQISTVIMGKRIFGRIYDNFTEGQAALKEMVAVYKKNGFETTGISLDEVDED